MWKTSFLLHPLSLPLSPIPNLSFCLLAGKRKREGKEVGRGWGVLENLEEQRTTAADSRVGRRTSPVCQWPATVNAKIVSLISFVDKFVLWTTNNTKISTQFGTK
jgi:hypothetical protein